LGLLVMMEATKRKDARSVTVLTTTARRTIVYLSVYFCILLIRTLLISIHTRPLENDKVGRWLMGDGEGHWNRLNEWRLLVPFVFFSQKIEGEIILEGLCLMRAVRMRMHRCELK
jgi:ABC-type enterobactin transport system permease subunit